MSTPDLLYSDVEQDLRSNVHRLLNNHGDWPTVLSRCESTQPYDLDLWHTLASDLGLAGLLVDERFGGAGASTRELGVLAEELGSSVAPVPFLGSVLATSVLSECTDHAHVPEVLSALCAGRSRGTVALALTSSPSAPFPETVAFDGDRLTGSVSTVVDLEVVDQVIVPAMHDRVPGLYLVNTAADGVSRTSATPLDLTRRFGTLTLHGAECATLVRGPRAVEIVRRSTVTAAGVLASEQIGLAQRCLDATVDYVATRYQFGRQIGSFQAIKHRLADLWTAVSNGRAVARNAADRLAQDEERELAVAMAASYCSELAVLAAEEHLQLHGGIGMTWEHPAHLYLGRAKSSELVFGTGECHRARLAELVELPLSDADTDPPTEPHTR